MARNDAILSMRDVHYAYPDASNSALYGLNFEARRGEWVALVGSNGSGKSTFAKICNALLLPTQGACFVLSLDTAEIGRAHV